MSYTVDTINNKINGCKDCHDYHIKYLSEGFKVKDLQSQLQQKDKVIEILKSTCDFYADKESWTEMPYSSNKLQINKDSEDSGRQNAGWEAIYIGGFKARQALKAFEDLTQKENKVEL